MHRIFDQPSSLYAAVGEHLGYSQWRAVTAEDVSAFADVTADHQWIHVDPVRAAAGPFGGPVAHGFLVLSLLPVVTAEVFEVRGVRMAVNYGLNRVRFPAPTPVGSRIRGGVTLVGCTDVTGGLQLTLEVSIGVQDAPKPSCVAEQLVRLYL